MNISVFASGKNVFVNREYIKGYAFKNALLWVKSVLLWTATPILMANFELLRDNSAIFNASHTDRFECLLPHKISAC